jgi:RNA polymerase sigma-70 factor (ECF subfamily)
MTPPKLQQAIELPFPATIRVIDRAVEPAVESRVLTVFDECALPLRRYVASFNLGATMTEDIFQDVFLALFRHLSLGRPETNLKGWVFQVAHNLALKQRQRAARRLHVEGSWDATAADRIRDEELNPEERCASDQRQRHLASVLRRLPERDRQCVYLRAEGLRYRDIAKVLGISLGSVAKSMVRAVTSLSAADRG